MSKRFANLDLPWYTKEDLEDLEGEYPGLFDKTPEEIEKVATDFYWEAERMYATASSIENKADCLREYLREIGYERD